MCAAVRIIKYICQIKDSHSDRKISFGVSDGVLFQITINTLESTEVIRILVDVIQNFDFPIAPLINLLHDKNTLGLEL